MESDWAGDMSDRKPTSAYILMMAGAAVTWTSTKQTIIATSTCETEYVSMSATSNEAIWLGTLILKVQRGSSFETRKLENVLHVPNFEFG